MTPPIRWKDDEDSDAPPEMRDLLRAAKPSRGLSASERRRSAARVANLVSIPLAVSISWLWAKGIAVAGVAALTVVVVAKAPSILEFVSAPPAVATSRGIDAHSSAVGDPAPPAARELQEMRPEEGPPASPAPPSEGAPPAGDLPQEPTEGSLQLVGAAARRPGAAVRGGEPVATAGSEPRPQAPRREPAPAEPGAPTTTASPVDSLAKEASLLEAARSALDVDPARAIALLDQHKREFPRGQLVAERNVLRLDALRRLGRVSEADADGRALLEGDAKLYERRVRKMLGAQPPSRPEGAEQGSGPR